MGKQPIIQYEVIGIPISAIPPPRLIVIENLFLRVSSEMNGSAVINLQWFAGIPVSQNDVYNKDEIKSRSAGPGFFTSYIVIGVIKCYRPVDTSISPVAVPSRVHCLR